MIEFDKSRCDAIKVPQNIDDVIINSIYKKKKANYKKHLKYISAAAACFLIFLLMLNVSPAFAEFVSKVPGLESLVEFARFDKGLTNAIQNGYVQHINKSAKDKGIKITINDIICDTQKMIIACDVTSAENVYSLIPRNFELKNSKGNNIPCAIGISYQNVYNITKTNKAEIIIELQFTKENYDIPKNLILCCNSIDKTTADYYSKEIDGKWNIAFSINNILTNVQPQIYNINKNCSIDPIKFNICNAEIYPTTTNVEIKIEKNNNYIGTSLINPRLADENGNEYKMTSSITKNDIETINCESIYFAKPKELKFKCDGVFFIPENQYITLDVEHKKVIDDCGYSIEFISYDEHENYLQFLSKDKELINDQGGISIGNVYDENGYNCEISEEGQYPKINNSIKIGIRLKNMQTTPKILKLHVCYASKGCRQPFEMKIK